MHHYCKRASHYEGHCVGCAQTSVGEVTHEEHSILLYSSGVSKQKKKRASSNNAREEDNASHHTSTFDSYQRLSPFLSLSHCTRIYVYNSASRQPFLPYIQGFANCEDSIYIIICMSIYIVLLPFPSLFKNLHCRSVSGLDTDSPITSLVAASPLPALFPPPPSVWK